MRVAALALGEELEGVRAFREDRGEDVLLLRVVQLDYFRVVQEADKCAAVLRRVDLEGVVADVVVPLHRYHDELLVDALDAAVDHLNPPEFRRQKRVAADALDYFLHLRVLLVVVQLGMRKIRVPNRSG